MFDLCHWYTFMHKKYVYIHILTPPSATGKCIYTQVVVVGNPANTNAMICSHFAPSIPKENFTALTRLDHNRAKAQVSVLGWFTIIYGGHCTCQRHVVITNAVYFSTLPTTPFCPTAWHTSNPMYQWVKLPEVFSSLTFSETLICGQHHFVCVQ